MLNREAYLAMSASDLKALPGKFDIKRYSPSTRYFSGERSIHVAHLLCFVFSDKSGM